MSKLNVKLVTLPKFRALCFHGFGPSPEEAAYTKAEEWVKAHGATLKDGTPRRYFGYDNPSPSRGSPNYGYDVWVTIDPEVEAEPETRIIDFPGGRYAVARVEAGPQGEGIGETWKALAAWVENSPHQAEYCRRECLEESLRPFANNPEGFTLDLFEPIGG